MQINILTSISRLSDDASISRLSDDALVARIRGLVRRDRVVTAQLIAHLAELDTRDVFLREGYASLYLYCRDALGMSDGEAYNRIEVARAARRFPAILNQLASGAVSLTAIRLLAPHLTTANHRDVLESAGGKKKAEIEEIVARLSPRPDVPASVRKLPSSVRKPAATATVSSLRAPEHLRRPHVTWTPFPPPHSTPPRLSAASPLSLSLDVPPEHSEPAVPAVRPFEPIVTSLSPGRYKLQLTIGGDTLEKLRLAKDMLSHALPSGDDAAVLDRALTVLLVDLARTKYANTPKPRPSRKTDTAGSHPSAAVKRAVWVRDIGRCRYVSANGHRCEERRFVEFHHLDPRALHGAATVDGIELRCRRHNDYEGRLYFGRRRRATGAEADGPTGRPSDTPRRRSALVSTGSNPLHSANPPSALNLPSEANSFRNKLEATTPVRPGPWEIRTPPPPAW